MVDTSKARKASASRRRPRAQVSKSVLSFFLDSPPAEAASSPARAARLPKSVSWDEQRLREPVDDRRRLSVRPAAALERSRSAEDGGGSATSVASASASRRSRVLPRSTSSSSSLASKKRPRSLANHLGGFALHAVTPRESSILQYTSLASPGTHMEYELVLEDAAAGGSWVVARRYSAFRSLRDELARVFDRRRHPGAATSGRAAHCTHCAPMLRSLEQLTVAHFPKRRLWGSSSPKVVQQRSEQFFSYLTGLLALATDASTRRCPLVTLGFAVQLRTFLTLEREPFRGAFASGGGVPFLLTEMTLMANQAANGTTLMTIDELDAANAYATEDDDDRTSSLESISDFPSPLFVLEEQGDEDAWDELENWRGAVRGATGRSGRSIDRY